MNSSLALILLSHNWQREIKGDHMTKTDGIFDNRETMQREAWADGKLVGRWPAAMCTDTRQTLTKWERTVLEKPWAAYPPRTLNG